MPGSKTRRQEDHQAAEGRVDRLLVEVLNAVDEATSVHGEWDPIQAAAAHHTGKAVRMISLPCGSENPLHDGLGANAALLQGILGRKRKNANVKLGCKELHLPLQGIFLIFQGIFLTQGLNLHLLQLLHCRGFFYC